jgi:hypothetical protein
MQRFRAYGVELVLIGILLTAVFFFGYLGYGLLRPEIIDEPFSGEKALANVARQLEFGARSTGTEGSQRMGDWLIEQLRIQGWDVVIQPITIGDTLTGRNIIGVRSPDQAGAPVAILATHYDTRLVADADPDPAQQTTPPPGANDNASGVAVLLELARTLDVSAAGHTVCLAFFDADANSDLPGWSPHMGSQIFVDSQPESVPRCASPQFVVDLNQVGADGQVFFQNATDDRTLQDAIWQTAAELGWSDTFLAEIKPPPADYSTPFDVAEVDAVHITGAGYPFAATTLDTLDRLAAATLERVGRTLETWLEDAEQ